MSKRRITLVFPQELIKAPIVFQMAKEFDVVPNIRKARVTETIGEMTLELEGPEDRLEKAIQSMRKKGVKVESATGENVT